MNSTHDHNTLAFRRPFSRVASRLLLSHFMLLKNNSSLPSHPPHINACAIVCYSHNCCQIFAFPKLYKHIRYSARTHTRQSHIRIPRANTFRTYGARLQSTIKPILTFDVKKTNSKGRRRRIYLLVDPLNSLLL